MANGLSPQKRELLEKLRSGELKLENKPTASSLGFGELSFAEQRLYVLDLIMEEESVSYNMPAALQITGKLNPTLLRECFHQILTRHEILRTQYTMDGDLLRSQVTEVTFELPVSDLRRMEEVTQSAFVDKFRTAFYSHRFVLSSAPLLIARLFWLRDEKWCLLINMHHIVADGWSLGVLTRELVEIYTSRIEGRQISLPNLDFQYRDYADWQRSTQQLERHDEQLEYWLRRLVDLPDRTTLPSDFVAKGTISKGAVCSEFLSPESYQGAKLQSEKHGGSIFPFLLAVLGILINRFGGDVDIVIGSPVANRNRLGVQPLIGCFVNTLIYRLDLASVSVFDDYLKDVIALTREASAHQDLPFDKLVEAINPLRLAGENPIFRVFFLLEDEPDDIEFSNLKIVRDQGDLGLVKFDLTLRVVRGKDALHCNFEYDTTQFASETINNMAQSFATIFEDAVKSPNSKVSQLGRKWPTRSHELVTPADAVYPMVHYKFHEQALANPHGVAVICDNQEFSFSWIEEQSNKVANLLLNEGLRRGDVVALFFERGVEVVIALLGALKAGVAYIALDSAGPLERLKYAIKQANVRILLTKDMMQEAENLGVAVVVEVAAANLVEFSSQMPVIEQSSDDLAYVQFTSGSTGYPKGVCVTHRNIAGYANAIVAAIPELKAARSLVITKFTTDFENTLLYGAMVSGGTLVLARDSDVLDSAAIERLMAEARVEVCKFTPSYFQSMADSLAFPSTLRGLIFGGEQLSPDVLNRIPRDLRVYNHYGPTETTVGVCCGAVQFEPRRRIAIGRVLSGYQMYVLDEYGHAVPQGGIGELVVSGVGLSKGYLGELELTEGSFVKHPDDEELNVYKTGDLVRQRSSGEYEFVGRRDRQVKIRGYRVELSEITSQVFGLPSVADCAVDYFDELVAYVVGDGNLEVSTLRNQLEHKLPDWMLPNRWVEVARLPRLANGKIDYLALRRLEAPKDSNFEFVLTDLEIRLAKLWLEVLPDNVDVTPDSNFFELGGDSIRVAKLVSLCRKDGLALKPSAVFSKPILRSLCQSMSDVIDEASQNVAFPVSAGLLKLLFGQQLVGRDDQCEVLQLDIGPGVGLSAQQILVQLDEALDLFPALRSRYEVDDESVRIEPPLKRRKPTGEVVSLDVRTIDTSIDRMRQGIDVRSGTGVAFSIAEKGDRQAILIVVHRALANPWMWRQLLENLSARLQSEVVERTENDRPDHIGPDSPASTAEQDLRAMKAFFKAEDANRTLPVDRHSQLRSNLDASITFSDLRLAASAFRVSTTDVLLISFVLALDEMPSGRRGLTLAVAGSNQFLENNEGFGEWNDFLYQVRFNIPENTSALSTIGELADQIKQARYMAQNGSASLENDVQIGFVFEDLRPTQFPNLPAFGDLRISKPYVEEDAGAIFPLELCCVHTESSLALKVSYETDRFRSDDIFRFAQRFEKEVLRFVALCREPTIGYLTPADAPLLEVSQSQLDNLVTRFVGEFSPSTTLSERLQEGSVRLETISVLSPMQQGMIFHSVAAPESGVYVVQASCELRELEIDRFMDAWQETVADHSILRSLVFNISQGTPVRYVLSNMRIPFDVLDWRDLGPEEQALRFAEFINNDRKRGFRFHTEPLIRFTFINVGGGVHKFVWSHHHALLDGWSTVELLGQVASTYLGIKSVRRSDYERYLNWMENWDNRAAKQYWKKYSEAIQVSTSIAADLDGKSAYSSYPHSCRRVIPRKDADVYREFCHEKGFTTYGLIEAAWALVLAAYSGQKQVVFGSVVSGRPGELVDADSIIGPLFNVIPVCIDINFEYGADEFLAHQRKVQTDRVDFEYLPNAEIQTLAGRSLNDPLFTLILNYVNYDYSFLAGRELLSIGSIESYQRSSFPLDFVVFDSMKDQIDLDLTYDETMYSEEFVDLMLESFVSVLDSLVSSDTGTLQDIAFVPDVARSRSAEALNGPSLPSNVGPFFYELVRDQARIHPDRPAVIASNGSLSYGDLFVQVDRVTQHLLEAGISRGDHVGIMIEKGFELPIIFLALLEIGAAALFLDEDEATQRRKHKVEEAGCRAIVHRTQKANSDQLGWSIDMIGSDFNSTPTNTRTCDEVAYLVFTSGSTGKPKGIAIGHESLTNLAKYFCSHEIYTDGPCQRVGVCASLVFDAWVQQFVSLACGSTLCLIPDELKRDPASLVRYVADLEVDVLDLTPTLLSEYLREMVKQGLGESSLKVIVGGEKVTSKLIAAIEDASAKKLIDSVYVAYGPSECCVDTTVGRIFSDSVEGVIGQPITNTKLEIVMENGLPAPPGVVGELHIAGCGVGLGYISGESDGFRVNSSGLRLYATGDILRQRLDGTLQFVGRQDFQVKIRGYRVELGEIEVVATHAFGREIVVVVAEGTSEELYPVAFYLKDDSLSEPSPEVLWSLLPSYMVPHHFHCLDAYPINKNSKIDRERLKGIHTHRLRASSETDAEELDAQKVERMLEIWDSAFDSPVDFDDDFFEIGGFSITAIKVLAEIKEEWGVTIPVETFFELLTPRNVLSFVAAMSDRTVTSGDGGDTEMVEIVI